MTKISQNFIDESQAQAFAADHLGLDSVKVELVGEGAWSRCFGFRRGDEDLVIRFGNHLDDFEKDQRAYAYHTPHLPIPHVLEIGQAFGGYYAISSRVYGVPLESLNASQWADIVPSLVDMLEALRTTDLSAAHGFGGWGSDGNAGQVNWSGHILAVGSDAAHDRLHGWRERLAASPEGMDAFEWGCELLEDVITDEIPRSLVHCDLINRNVLVSGKQISGVFDWGCSLYGDHLYDLAWFEFWAPWCPALDIPLLRSELEKRWETTGYVPKNKARRLAACYLHIGIDHLIYNAYLGDMATLEATAKRMQLLVSKA